MYAEPELQAPRRGLESQRPGRESIHCARWTAEMSANVP